MAMKKNTCSFLFKMLVLVTLAAVLSQAAPVVSLASSPSPGSLKETEIPVLEIVLGGYNEEEIERDFWQPASAVLTYGDKQFNSMATIKGRGNYTWAQVKRPYAIKLDEKQNWFGFGAAKDWVLLADYTDQTHLRNYFAFTLASGFCFAFTPRTRHAQVYINGVYRGLYLIAEKVEIDAKRLDINVAGGDLLLELDNNYGWGEPETLTTKLGNLLVIKDPDRDEFDERVQAAGSKLKFANAKRFVKTQINSFEDGLQKGWSLENLDKYLDIDSLVDWYIFNEIVKNDDTVFNSSIYLYSRYGDKLYMGPVWDYDLCLSGIDRFANTDPTGLQFTDNPWEREGNWFLYLAERDDFNVKVKARWQELYSSGLFSNSAKEVRRTADLIKDQIGYDVELWHNDGVFVRRNSFDDAVSYLLQYYYSRILWLNGIWGDPASTVVPEATETPAPSETPAPETTEPAETTPDSAETYPPPVNKDREPERLKTARNILIAAGCAVAVGAVGLVVVLIVRRRKRRK